MPLEEIAVDAATQYLAGVAARNFGRMIGYKRRSRPTESGEGEASGRNKRVQGIFTSLAYSKEKPIGKPMSMRACKSIISKWSGSVQWVTYQWGRLTDDALATGTSALSYQLKNQEGQIIPVGTVAAPANANDATEYPFHIYSLCDRHYFTASNDVTGPGRFAYAEAATPQLKFGYLTSTNNVSQAVQNDWNVWSAYSSDSDPQLRSDDVVASLLKNVRVELLLQGAIGAPTTFHVDFIRVHDDRYGPNAPASLDRDQAFYPLIRNLLGNPINGMPLPTKSTDTISVFKSYTYYIAPTTNIDYDTTPSQRHVSIDLNLNQVIKWNWVAQNDNIGYKAYDQANVFPSTYQVQHTVDPQHHPPDYKDRVFMIIRATNARQNVTSGNTIPQYDIRIKATHVFNTNNSS